MAAPDTEPENYSLDEMMERLRSRTEGGAGDDTPELVTRADGSQMYKVRKRKRRTQQPKKEAEKRKTRSQMLLVVAGGGVVGLSLLGFLGSLVYLSSASFKDKIMGQVETWTHSKVTSEGLRFTPASVAAKEFILNFPEDSMIASLKAFELKGDVRVVSYLSGPLSGTEISANAGVLNLREPTGLKNQAPSNPGTLPFQFRYHGRHFDIVGGNPDRPAFDVHQTEASFMVQENNKANLQLEGGTVVYQNWEPFRLNFASLQMENGSVRLGRLSLNVPGADRSEIELLDPSNSPLNFEGGKNTYDLKATKVPMSTLAGRGLGAILSCDVDSLPAADGKKASLVFEYGADSQLSFTIPFRSNSAAHASRLPMFDYLAKRLNTEEYRNPKFDLNARGVIYRDQAGVRIEEIQLDNKGYISIAGRMSADPSGALSGQLEIGIPDAVVGDGGMDFQTAFTRSARGMKWLSVHLSGSVDQPQDDLEKIIVATGKLGADHTQEEQEDKAWDEATKGQNGKH